jgi:ferric-dicitrate binding protein FerR (iron transport regulator)
MADIARLPPLKPESIDPKIKAQALHWLIELECAESIDALWPQFQTWLCAAPANRQMYLWVERCWHEVGTLMDVAFGRRRLSGGEIRR